MSKYEDAIEHYEYGINCDIFKEPVTTYARLAVEALRAQQERLNPKPLKLDELSKREGKPIWLETGEVSIGEQIIGLWEILEKITPIPVKAFWFTRRKAGFSDFNYGVTWLAYDYPPEKEEKR